MIKDVEVKLSGQSFTVGRFSVSDIHRVGELVYRVRRDRLVDDLNAIGLDAEAKLAKVNELRAKWENGLEVLRAAYFMDGAQIICREALQKSGHDTALLDDCEDLKELVLASTMICGLPDPFAESEQEDEADEVDDEIEEIKPDDR